LRRAPHRLPPYRRWGRSVGPSAWPGARLPHPSDRGPLGPEQPGGAADAGSVGRRSGHRPGVAGRFRAPGRAGGGDHRRAGRRIVRADRRQLQRQSGVAAGGPERAGRPRGQGTQDRGPDRHARAGAGDGTLSCARGGHGRGRRCRPGVLRRAVDEIPVGRPSTDSPGRLRPKRGGFGPAGRSGHRAGRRGDGEGFQRVEGISRGVSPGGA
jgi:hypothetical protein